MYLEDGYQSLFSFSENGSVHLLEKTVTPPGMDGGDAIDVTTMRNVDWRTFAFRQLITLSEAGMTAAYDPVVYNELLAMINVNQLITQTFPDGSTLAFWGALRTMTPNELTEGEHPTVQCAVTPSNRNASQVETAPVFTPAP